MADTSESALQRELAKAEFPRASAYDPRWIIENAMGPQVLWLAEGLSQVFELKPGMRVLDLGCGRAVSSIFLAREFGVTVWAADWWVSPTENSKRIEKSKIGDRVFPPRAEAHAMPFADEFFHAIVSFDAYHYFGTDDLYLVFCTRHLAPGGRIGIVVPGVVSELTNPPEHLQPYWMWDFCSFHSPGWWRNHWQKTSLVEIETADLLREGWKLWLEWEEVRAREGREPTRPVPVTSAQVAEMLRVDAGSTFCFTRMVGRKL
jgi:SAM-dependent methyltransferase